MLSLFYYVLGAFGIHLTVDGVKTAVENWFGKIDPRLLVILPFFFAFILIVVVRGGTFPDSAGGWIWFFGLVVLIGFLAQGWFRLFKRFAPQDTTPDVMSPAAMARQDNRIGA